MPVWGAVSSAHAVKPWFLDCNYIPFFRFWCKSEWAVKDLYVFYCQMWSCAGVDGGFLLIGSSCWGSHYIVWGLGGRGSCWLLIDIRMLTEVCPIEHGLSLIHSLPAVVLVPWLLIIVAMRIGVGLVVLLGWGRGPCPSLSRDGEVWHIGIVLVECIRPT